MEAADAVANSEEPAEQQVVLAPSVAEAVVEEKDRVAVVVAAAAAVEVVVAAKVTEVAEEAVMEEKEEAEVEVSIPLQYRLALMATVRARRGLAGPVVQAMTRAQVTSRQAPRRRGEPAGLSSFFREAQPRKKRPRCALFIAGSLAVSDKFVCCNGFL